VRGLFYLGIRQALMHLMPHRDHLHLRALDLLHLGCHLYPQMASIDPNQPQSIHKLFQLSLVAVSALSISVESILIVFWVVSARTWFAGLSRSQVCGYTIGRFHRVDISASLLTAVGKSDLQINQFSEMVRSTVQKPCKTSWGNYCCLPPENVNVQPKLWFTAGLKKSVHHRTKTKTLRRSGAFR